MHAFGENAIMACTLCGGGWGHVDRTIGNGADRPAAPWYSTSEDRPLSRHDRGEPASPPGHGQSGKIGLLRYIFGNAVALAVLFGLFLVAGMEF